MDKTIRDLELLRAQTDLANRKAEEARERNALLLAHLLDKEKVERENEFLKENIKSLEQAGLKAVRFDLKVPGNIFVCLDIFVLRWR